MVAGWQFDRISKAGADGDCSGSPSCCSSLSEISHVQSSMASSSHSSAVWSIVIVSSEQAATEVETTTEASASVLPCFGLYTSARDHTSLFNRSHHEETKCAVAAGLL